MPTAPPQTRALVIDWPDGQRVPLRIAAEPFAEGGDARLFDVVGRTDLVAKLYRDPAADPQRRAKLADMLATPPADLAVHHDGQRYVQLAWPEALIEPAEPASDDAPPLGFVMPRVDLNRAVDLELLLSARGRRAARLPASYRTRVTVAHNLAAVVTALHAVGDHVIDLKPTNVHVHRGAFFVAMLDCDGFSIGPADAAESGLADGAREEDPADGGSDSVSADSPADGVAERFPAHQYTDGYIAPEALRARARPEALGEAQDRFALAVVLFRLMSGGYHPFQGVPRPGASVPTTDGERVAAGLYPYSESQTQLTPPPGSLYPAFDAGTRSLFDAAFASSPADRPSARAWQRHLRGLVDGGLQPCSRDPDHARFGDAACRMCGPSAEPPFPKAALSQLAKVRDQPVLLALPVTGRHLATAAALFTGAVGCLVVLILWLFL